MYSLTAVSPIVYIYIYIHYTQIVILCTAKHYYYYYFIGVRKRIGVSGFGLPNFFCNRVAYTSRTRYNTREKKKRFPPLSSSAVSQYLQLIRPSNRVKVKKKKKTNNRRPPINSFRFFTRILNAIQVSCIFFSSYNTLCKYRTSAFITCSLLLLNV